MRCVNIDWLEVSAEEPNDRYPMDAGYYWEHGYTVTQRDYGTRVWSQVFTIDDADGHPWIEVRREPPSGKSEFTGLSETSCRLRLVNAQCYVTDCVERLRQFMVKNGYIFRRIYRIDICYDFEYFDYGDLPARFARRYIERRYRKVNQAKLHVVGDDNWTDFDWQSLSWGSTTSMVSTKMYNKSLELRTVSKEKTYIPLAWMQAGLLDNPVARTKKGRDGKDYTPEIWRVEFSLKSKADRWIVIEDISGKKVKKKAIPHTLALFDTPDKLWYRFEELAYHYFRFKISAYKQHPRGLASLALDGVQLDDSREMKRKDLCVDKRLFRFNFDREFLHIDNCVSSRKPDNDWEVLRRRLTAYSLEKQDPKIHQAISVLLHEIETDDLRRYTPRQLFVEVESLRRTLHLKLKYPETDVIETIAEIQQMLFNDEVF